MVRRFGGLVAALLALVAWRLLGRVEPARAASPIRHVFIIVLENESASTTFSPNLPRSPGARLLS